MFLMRDNVAAGLVVSFWTPATWTAASVLLFVASALGADQESAQSSSPPTADADARADLERSSTADRPAAPSTSSRGGTPQSTTVRMREGVELADRVGHFKLSGDRATFYAAEGGARLVGLENLNLERVVRSVSENPDQQWKVSGVVTEFRGGNYLLITRAIMLNKPSVARQTP
jgi:hypothetical protein